MGRSGKLPDDLDLGLRWPWPRGRMWASLRDKGRKLCLIREKCHVKCELVISTVSPIFVLRILATSQCARLGTAYPRLSRASRGV